MSDANSTFPADPESRRIDPNHRGVPITLGDGKEWILPLRRLGPDMAEARDEVADFVFLRRKVDDAVATRLYGMAMCLITRAYELSPAEAAVLLLGADQADLFCAVTTALAMPPDDDRSTRRTYSDWLRSGLLANGLVPERIPEADLPFVVKHLVATGRMVPADAFVSSAISSKIRSDLLASFQD